MNKNGCWKNKQKLWEKKYRRPWGKYIHPKPRDSELSPDMEQLFERLLEDAKTQLQ